MSSNPVQTVERLIAAVARAFYTDNVVIVLDALVREKYIRNEEIGPRLKLSGKDVRKVLILLEEELLVKYEDLTMDDGKTSQCWYIDYQHFVYVVRFRVYLIQHELDKQEALEYNHLYFECPSCQARYSELEAVRLLSKDNKFICSHCCPTEDFRSTMSQPRFCLAEVDNRSRLKEVQTMKRKLREQFYSSELHDGIYNLLAELKDVPIIRNRPSENIKRGLGASKVTDQDTRQEIADNSKERGRAKKDVRGTIQSFLGRDMVDGEFRVEISSTADSTSNLAGDTQVLKRAKAMPTFLLGSRVTGSSEVFEETNMTTTLGGSEASVQTMSVVSARTDVVENVLVESSTVAESSKVTTLFIGMEAKSDVADSAADDGDVDWEDG